MNLEIIERVLSRNPRKIFSKEECYALYEEGLLGNKALTWKSYGEILDSGWSGQVCMRSKKGVARKEVRYNLNIDEVPEHIRRFSDIGIPENMIGFNQNMPDKYLLLQGEIMFNGNKLYLLYSAVKKPMNLALAKRSFTIDGNHAEDALFENLTPESRGDLERLMSKFPTSVVEFSAYSLPLGNMAHLNRNTVIWEVRDY